MIIDLDYHASSDRFAKHGIDNFENIYSYARQTGLFEKFEKGMISPKYFRDELRKIIRVPLTDREIDDAWNAVLLDIPPERIELLKALKSRFRIFLLSNTNIIHYEFYVAGLNNKYGYRDFSELFEKAYFSHEIGSRKPDSEIYEFVIREKSLVPSETLFIDDTPENVEGAQRVGLLTYLLPPHQSITDLFNFKFLKNES